MNKTTDCRWEAQLCVSAKQLKCLTAEVKYETSFITYLKMPCRLETVVGETLDGLVVLLSLLHVNLEKLPRKTSRTALLKLLVQLSWVQKTMQRLTPKRGTISQGTIWHSGTQQSYGWFWSLLHFGLTCSDWVSFMASVRYAAEEKIDKHLEQGYKTWTFP